MRGKWLCSAALRKGSRCAPAIKRFSHLARTVLGSLECSSLGPPPQIPRGPATRAPRAGLLRLRSSQPRASVGPLLYHIHPPPLDPHQKRLCT
ncbi:hypothetical protein PHYSODRAFT_530262 [Phytophthora sojae]|uniref:Uncharacterized protein n=1 Tax=Phytophthora sojae (strain P6497) TaxID=1094619 RepID=G5AC34_PHYSP|nr:hypothetical protein PHYSODRAFT_530262 [Phytophthora sojae]EGZ06909.1 hypothetical protein PHYSODRAFT_530262 [Phytophthora sojae]|eukprot:XP_009537673.1 hypothetical protein PHYSODRAFT_530262 [Phytophthora sojae]